MTFFQEAEDVIESDKTTAKNEEACDIIIEK